MVSRESSTRTLTHITQQPPDHPQAIIQQNIFVSVTEQVVPALPAAQVHSISLTVRVHAECINPQTVVSLSSLHLSRRT